MKTEHPYTPARVPVPHFPVTVGSPFGGDPASDLLALVDSGADRTLIPAALVQQLQLPEVDRLEFEVGGGKIITLPITHLPRDTDRPRVRTAGGRCGRV